MDVADQQQNNKRKRKSLMKKWNKGISFSACLPDDVGGDFAAESICAVKLSTDPFSDMRESILEMIRDVGIHDWNEMEELVYCYVALNSTEVHEIIADAFLSICSSVMGYN